MPSSGPTADQLLAHPATAPSYQLVDLDSPDAAAAADAPASSLRDLDDAAPSAAPDQIFAGDVLDITVFEVGASLFVGARQSLDATGAVQSSPPTAGGQEFPDIKVGEDGRIALPYLGSMTAEGLTPRELARRIEQALHGHSQSPQVVVAVKADVGDTVMVIGDVKQPGRRPLSAAHESILDIIALAGGPSGAKPDSLVRLTRAGRSRQIALERLTADSPENLRLRPQDRIEVIDRPRTFTAFGASGRVSEVPFQVSEVTLAQAIARVGGPLDQLADPRSVFVLRTSQEAGVKPVIYRLDLTKADGYFAAQKFLMRDGDMIYIANAKINSTAKLIGLFTAAAQPVVEGRQLAQ
jgi:polysaccharide export outer membrane protein